MKFLLRHTIYAHFCAGETSFEVSRTVEALRKQGISGVMLGHGKELEVRAENFAKAGGSSTSASAAAVSNGGENATWEIDEWTKGNLETIGLTPPGAWVSIKMTGAGALTRHHLSKALPPPKEIEKAFASLVELATGKRVSLGIDAEQSHFQAGIDEWALSWAERYNRRGVPNTGGPNTNPSAQVNVDDGSYTCVYNTYQAYLKSASSRLIRDLRRARKEGFVLGVKLVRGAYLASEARHLPWSSKAETDTAYDGIAEALMRRQWIGPLKEGAREEARIVEKGFPEVSLCIATHNAASVRKALKLRQSQVEAGEKRIPMVYGQLYGMADYVTGELIGAAKAAERAAQEGARESNKGMMEVESPKVWKYLVWGTVDECAKYLVRRAEENRDAVSRTGEAREEYGRELWRRLRSVFIAGR
ncbi:MAG: hypothetical protein LQ340_004596 [Diploschistes diacapsis]|nr:MAG: hypothetical protein LQ340_004596 [Diploschistes diacapsis]